MAKRKNDVPYFSHDSNARDSRRILNMRMAMGVEKQWEAYGLYWAVIEVLRVAPDYSYFISNIKALAFLLSAKEDLLTTIIQDFELFTIEGNLFYSKSLRERMDLRSKQATDAVNKRWDKEKMKVLENEEVNTGVYERISTNIPNILSKVKKSKVKLSKEIKEKFIPPSLDEMKRYALENEYPEALGVKAWNYYTEMGWVDRDKVPVVSWKAKMQSVWFKPENKSKEVINQKVKAPLSFK